jgi:hypothetical protein
MSPDNPAPFLARPPLTTQDVLSKTDYFVDVQSWPLHSELDPAAWLENFVDSEKQHAIYLLNAFMYFSPTLVNRMFMAAFQSLSTGLYTPGDSFLNLQAKWRVFVDTVTITYVTGEIPNPTDSGLSFARKARQEIGIDEARIMAPDDAVRLLVRRPGPVVFVDDFVGSGNQFITTWQRQVRLPTGSYVSFERLCAIQGAAFYYCPLLCTEYGYQRLRAACSAVQINPAHILSHRYSALATDSVIWPPHLQPTAVNFVREASSRAGISDWQGFHGLGLAVALGDTVPDATLPIFYSKENGWRPLMERK